MNHFALVYLTPVSPADPLGAQRGFQSLRESVGQQPPLPPRGSLSHRGGHRGLPSVRGWGVSQRPVPPGGGGLRAGGGES